MKVIMTMTVMRNDNDCNGEVNDKKTVPQTSVMLIMILIMTVILTVNIQNDQFQIHYKCFIYFLDIHATNKFRITVFLLTLFS